MTLSEFWVAVDAVFGRGMGASLVSGHVLVALGFRTPQDLLEAGTRPQDVWEALCDDLDVSAEERWRHADRRL
ncbi:DUF3046 domain-containing protein [Micrococcales bacterium 31B]|nr:DUF3046 domain-containing protein [Micrococcales bacterium 31B]